MTEPIRLALAGAGIFARDDHVPAIRALGERFDIVAVYSRTHATAEALQAHLPHRADIYTDLDAMLRRQDIEAVDIVLPIEPLPEAVEKALTAGKHVVSEKPIAPDVATGRRLIQHYRAHAPQQVWMVAENLRYEESFQRAGEIVQSGAIGKPLMASWTMFISVNPDNKFYHTPWRRSGTFPGGFLLDGGVHHAAAFRQILGEIASVTAHVQQIRPDLPPADSLVAALQFENDVLGSYAVTYATGAPFREALTIVGETGALRVNDGAVEVWTNGTMHNETLSNPNNVEAELAAFADAVRAGQPHRNSALEALRDVAVVEAMLRSADQGCRVEVETFADLETPT